MAKNNDIIFKVDNILTTNNMNALRVIGVNECSICVQDLLTDDFTVLEKAERSYEIFNPITVLKKSLEEIINEVDVSKKDKEHIMTNMSIRINKFIRHGLP